MSDNATGNKEKTFKAIKNLDVFKGKEVKMVLHGKLKRAAVPFLKAFRFTAKKSLISEMKLKFSFTKFQK